MSQSFLSTKPTFDVSRQPLSCVTLTIKLITRQISLPNKFVYGLMSWVWGPWFTRCKVFFSTSKPWILLLTEVLIKTSPPIVHRYQNPASRLPRKQKPGQTRFPIRSTQSFILNIQTKIPPRVTSCRNVNLVSSTSTKPYAHTSSQRHSDTMGSRLTISHRKDVWAACSMWMESRASWKLEGTAEEWEDHFAVGCEFCFFCSNCKLPLVTHNSKLCYRSFFIAIETGVSTNEWLERGMLGWAGKGGEDVLTAFTWCGLTLI